MGITAAPPKQPHPRPDSTADPHVFTKYLHPRNVTCLELEPKMIRSWWSGKYSPNNSHLKRSNMPNIAGLSVCNLISGFFERAPTSSAKYLIKNVTLRNRWKMPTTLSSGETIQSLQVFFRLTDS